jgi:hypothetical protein
LTNAISTRPSQLINPDNYASIAGALADEEVGNAIAGDWVKVNDVFYTIITTSPTVASDFLLIGNVTQLSYILEYHRLTQPKLKYH